MSWHHAKGEYNDTGTGAGTTTHDGTGIGFGVGTAFTKQIEGRLEVEQVNYSREAKNLSTDKLKTSQATFYVECRF